MRIGIIAVGRMKNGPERELVARYLDRAQASGRQIGLSGFAITELAESRAGNPQTRKLEEAKAIQAALPDGAVAIALDETGKAIDSEVFATSIGDWRDGGKQDLVFIIGGPDGLAPEIRQRADKTIAFSPLTWPHQIVRILLAEQIYRASTILSNHPYHRS